MCVSIQFILVRSGMSARAIRLAHIKHIHIFCFAFLIWPLSRNCIRIYLILMYKIVLAILEQEIYREAKNKCSHGKEAALQSKGVSQQTYHVMAKHWPKI